MVGAALWTTEILLELLLLRSNMAEILNSFWEKKRSAKAVTARD
jgi:hypothetical protein